MKILKRILIGFGLLFVGLIGFFAYMGTAASEFRTEQGPFIEKFMKAFSENWEVASVRDKLSDDLLKQIDSQAGKNALGIFQTMGRFRSMTDLSLQSYSAGTWGKTGKFTFKGRFSNGPAQVEIIVNKRDGKTRVTGLHITPSRVAPATNVRREI